MMYEISQKLDTGGFSANTHMVYRNTFHGVFTLL